MPDTELPMADIAWPPLDEEPIRERYGVLQPIAPYPVDELGVGLGGAAAEQDELAKRA